MALSIRNIQAEKLARTVAKQTGESITQAIIHALEEKLERLNGRRTIHNLVEEIIEIAERCSNLPEKDQRTPEEIIGYNKETGGLD